MILLYSLVLILLGMVLFVINRRVLALESRYGKTALAAELLARDAALKGGNTNRPDALETAKHLLVLGQLVQKRDRVEAKWQAWQLRANRLDRLILALTEWKGRKLPYTFGALDITGALVLIDRYGVAPYLRLDYLIELIGKYLGS